MAKPEMKLEGDKLVIKAAHSVAVDTDKDGEAVLKASVTVDVEVDGSEALAELLKNSKLAQKAAEILKPWGDKTGAE